MCQTQYQLLVHYQPHLGFSQMCREDKKKVKRNSKKLERNENLCEHAAIATYWFFVLLGTQGSKTI